MACAKHPAEAAKERCSHCAAALCKTCLDESIIIGGLTLCPACAPEALRENIAEAEITKKWTVNAAVIAGALMCLGLVAAYTAYKAGGGDDGGLPGATAALVLFFGLARLSSVWAEIQATRRARAIKGEAPQNLLHEALAKVVVAVLFGAFIAPWATLRLLAIARHAEKEIKNSQALLDDYAD